MSLVTPPSVQKLQMALHAKAKESPDFRFYALYDKGYRKDVLEFVYERCKVSQWLSTTQGAVAGSPAISGRISLRCVRLGLLIQAGHISLPWAKT